MTAPGGRLVWIAHPSAELYGSDRQVLETATALAEAGWRVRVLTPTAGPLHALLSGRGIDVEVTADVPVLRRSVLAPQQVLGFAMRSARSAMTWRRRLLTARPDVVVVNTVVLPSWVAAGRLARIPVLCHVHEAENRYGRGVRTALLMPLLLASRVVTNSVTTEQSVLSVLPGLRARTSTVHNGVGSPASVGPTAARGIGDPLHLVVIGRLSSVKGTDIALEGVARARATGRDVRLTVCGAAFAGNEAFRESLVERAARPDLAGAVHFEGEVDSPWPWLEAADAALVPSRMESFGNSAAEAMMARRPVIVAAVQGLAEIVAPSETGWTFPGGDVDGLASAIGEVYDDPARARALADAGWRDARTRFPLARYREDIVAEVEWLGTPRRSRNTLKEGRR